MPFLIITFMFTDWRCSQIKIQMFANLDTRLALNDDELKRIKDNSYVLSLNNWVKEIPQDEMGNIFKGVLRSLSDKAQDIRYRNCPQ